MYVSNMALNHSVFFIKSPWTQCDFTHLLKEALHTIFVSQPRTSKLNKQKQIVQGDMTQILQQLNMFFFRGKYLHDCGLEAALMMKNVDGGILHIWGATEGDGDSFSPETATYCLRLVLRTK